MIDNLLLATRSGLVTCHRNGEEWHAEARSLQDKHFTCVIHRENVALAGSTDGIYRSEDAGRTWREASEGLTARHVRWMLYHPDTKELVFAGTEPAGIYVSQDGGMTWQDRPEVEQLRDQHEWSLPYSPAAGCVRGFAFVGTRGYAAVEVGGVLRSDDSGETWKLVEGSDGNPEVEGPPEQSVDPDVHSVYLHPWSRDVAFASTGGGFYRTTDGGKVWSLVYDCYCRAAWVNPDDPQNIILGPAKGVDRDGSIEGTNDGGLTWVSASGGLDVPWSHHMVERFIQAGDELLAVLSNSELLTTPIAGWEWKRIVPDVPGITSVCELIV